MKIKFLQFSISLLLVLSSVGLNALAEETTDVVPTQGQTVELSYNTRAVGETIAQTFPDSGLAKAVAEQIAKAYDHDGGGGYIFPGTTVNTILTQPMIDFVVELNVNNKKSDSSGTAINDLTGISLLSNLEILSLNGHNFSSLPAELFTMTSLKQLTLNGNKLKEIPSEIENLVNLEYFSISNSSILYLNKNVISTLPDSITNLSNLKFLIANDVTLTALPSNIGNLTSLEEIRVSDNALTQLPDSIGNLSALKMLVLENNPELKSLPATISSLSSLSELFINRCGFEEFPASLKDLSTLTILSINDNKITAISEDMYNFVTALDANADNSVDIHKQRTTVVVADPFASNAQVVIEGHPILNQTYAYTGSVTPFTYVLKDPSGTETDITSSVYPFSEGTSIKLPTDLTAQEGAYTLTVTANEGQAFYWSSSRSNTIYTWEFTVAHAQVIDLAPTLEVTPFIELPLGNDGVEFDPKSTIISASDDIDVLSVDDVVVNGAVDVNKAGIYIVEYSLDDTNADTATAIATQVVLINDGSYVVVGNYIINANDFSVDISEVPTITAENIITKSKVRVFDLTINEYLKNPSITVNSDALEAKVGEYPVILTYVKSPTIRGNAGNDLKITITLTVTEKVTPTLPDTGVSSYVVIAGMLLLLAGGLLIVRKSLISNKNK
ncbi:MAG: leucine-rich repeat domain-containing protein [Erysipelotrichaceae bacterium]